MFDFQRFLEKCSGCGKCIDGDSVRPNGAASSPFHPECFRCVKCNAIIDGKYYDLENASPVCKTDYVASRERCRKCDEPIMDTVLKAIGGSFHPDCFGCRDCSKSLDGVAFYVADDGDNALCKECYARSAAKRCSGCQSPILEDCLVSKNSGGYFHRECYGEQKRVS